MRDLELLVMASQAGITTDEFAATVRDWLETARHPPFELPYTELVYQPMLELLAYLRGNGFKTYIVSGGGIEFMRPWTDRVFGVSPEQVVGTSSRLGLSTPVLFRLPEVTYRRQDGQAGWHSSSGVSRSPPSATRAICSCCNKRCPGPGRRFGLIVHHEDAEREYAYDRDSHVGRLDTAWPPCPPPAGR